jgi:hypothetical protein
MDAVCDLWAEAARQRTSKSERDAHRLARRQDALAASTPPLLSAVNAQLAARYGEQFSIAPADLRFGRRDSSKNTCHFFETEGLLLHDGDPVAVGGRCARVTVVAYIADFWEAAWERNSEPPKVKSLHVDVYVDGLGLFGRRSTLANSPTQLANLLQTGRR